ncbi:polyprenyl synthetase family protein [Psychrobacter sp. I-STPA10]|uniref:polyprenyl synthetase family protein n=1 Tax=Psychrobacter sp. I-STPA10 TaxID=2585769 RepID=UPI003FA70DD1
MQNVLSVLEDDIAALFGNEQQSSLSNVTFVTLPEPLKAACHYAMTGSGKRVRPLLVACAFSSVNPQQPLNHACRRAMLAVELLHAYSLIHDDLPCMDDDDLRRGRPTCHIAFDEATALLAGDVLQTLAFEVLTSDILGFKSIDDSIAIQLLNTFAPRARRMVAGQMLDLNAEGQQISQDELEAIHRDKTGALIEAATMMGGICAHANSEQSTALQSFATQIGLAFQVQDDILDVTASTNDLGKPAGSDEKLDKSTYVKLMGIEPAKAYAKQLFIEAKADLLAQFTNSNSNDNISENNALIELAEWLWQRNK